MVPEGEPVFLVPCFQFQFETWEKGLRLVEDDSLDPRKTRHSFVGRQSTRMVMVSRS